MDYKFQAASTLAKNEQEMNTYEKSTFNIINDTISAAIENHLNVWEVACANYLDNKIDKRRFFNNYHIELNNLYKNFKEKIKNNPAGYTCIQKSL